eukprot:scaffold624_cov214-Pinguiococcus_pyrenoidosus.AAC.5
MRIHAVQPLEVEEHRPEDEGSSWACSDRLVQRVQRLVQVALAIQVLPVCHFGSVDQAVCRRFPCQHVSLLRRERLGIMLESPG